MNRGQGVLLSGGTGLVGQQLQPQLEGPVWILTRNPEKRKSSGEQATASAESSAESTAGDSGDLGPQRHYLKWDASSRISSQDLPSVRQVVHLAGDSVADGRWTTEKKQRIRDSRVIGTRCLVNSLAALQPRPEVLVAASAVGFYGDRPGEVLTEASPPGQGFLADVCQEWEREAMAAQDLGIRVCCVRIGVVMAKQGGALDKMLPIFRSGMGGPLGTGRQYFPWIHIDDLVGLIVFCLQHPEISGPLNGVAPQAITNREFTQALAKVLGRPALIPVPRFALRLVLGQFAESLFHSQQVRPQVPLDRGYNYRFPEIQAALDHLLG
jgi:uncharacterized protein (TIGR01777 family)